MSEKILSQAGVSLADIYDVEGSIAGVERLDARDVAVSHEMGGTIFSERLRASILLLPAVATGQSDDFTIAISNFGDEMARRITQINVFIGLAETNRIADCTVFASSRTLQAGVSREIPIWHYSDAGGGSESQMFFSNDGAAPANVIVLWPDNNTGIATFLPTMLVDIPNDDTAIDRIVMRGNTLAFGAGTVTATLLLMFLAPDKDQGSGVSSRGLPLPSW